MERPERGYNLEGLNIQYGDGVPVVVRDRESLLHGEGEQFIEFNIEIGKEREAL